MRYRQRELYTADGRCGRQANGKHTHTHKHSIIQWHPHLSTHCLKIIIIFTPISFDSPSFRHYFSLSFFRFTSTVRWSRMWMLSQLNKYPDQINTFRIWLGESHEPASTVVSHTTLVWLPQLCVVVPKSNCSVSSVKLHMYVFVRFHLINIATYMCVCVCESVYPASIRFDTYSHLLDMPIAVRAAFYV